MPYWTTTLTTAASASTPYYANWRGFAPLTVTAISNSSTMTGDFTIQYTLEDGTTNTSTNPYWINLSSGVGSSGFHFLSSSVYPDGTTVTFSTPIAAVRMFSTAISSSTMTLKVLQADRI